MLSITPITPAEPAKTGSSAIQYKPFLKVYKNAIELNYHMLKLLGLHITNEVGIHAANDSETGEGFLVVCKATGTGCVVAPASQNYMYTLSMPPHSVCPLLKAVANMQNTNTANLPYPFYLTTGAKHKIEMPEAEQTQYYRLKFEVADKK